MKQPAGHLYCAKYETSTDHAIRLYPQKEYNKSSNNINNTYY